MIAEFNCTTGVHAADIKDNSSKVVDVNTVIETSKLIEHNIICSKSDVREKCDEMPKYRAIPTAKRRSLRKRPPAMAVKGIANET